MAGTSVEVALDLRAQHAEGPLWDAASARLWWVDIAGRRVHCSDPASGADRSWPTRGQPGGVVLSASGEPVVATPDGLAVLDITTGATDLRVPIERDLPENRANDITVDSHGRAWVGTMALDKRAGNARLYRVDDGTATCVVEGLTISNGPAVDEVDGLLYLADTALCVVDVFDLDPASGTLSARRRLLDFSDVGAWPDGMTVDDDGMLWVALGREGEVHRYDPDGRLDDIVVLPTSNPTSVAFGGADCGELYITSSWLDLEEEDRVSQPLAGAVFVCRPGVTGRPSPRLAHLPADGSLSAPVERGTAP